MITRDNIKRAKYIKNKRGVKEIYTTGGNMKQQEEGKIMKKENEKYIKMTTAKKTTKREEMQGKPEQIQDILTNAR